MWMTGNRVRAPQQPHNKEIHNGTAAFKLTCSSMLYKTMKNTTHWTDLLVALVDKDVVSIRLEVMRETGSKDILVANTESLHEHVFHVISFVLQQLHQTPIQCLQHIKYIISLIWRLIICNILCSLYIWQLIICRLHGLLWLKAALCMISSVTLMKYLCLGYTVYRVFCVMCIKSSIQNFTDPIVKHAHN